jgi:hypothetical protein
VQIINKNIMALAILATPLIAGGIRIEVSDATKYPEAQQKHAVLVARITACLPQHEATMAATAEGVEDGVRRSIPLQVIRLAEDGTFAFKREWDERGTWVVKLVASYPENKNYAAGMLVPVMEKGSFGWTAVERYSHEPTGAEAGALLERETVMRASIN